MTILAASLKGGPGSGYRGHAGRPGERGGSSARLGAAMVEPADAVDTDPIPLESIQALSAWLKKLDATEHIEIDPPPDPRNDPLTRKLVARAIEAEPAITSAVKAAVERSKGRLEGLDKRLKSPGSISRKIDGWAGKFGGAERAAQMIMDAVRYTVVVRPEDLVMQEYRIVDDLYHQGHRVVDARNHFDNTKYKGYHVWLATPQGFEYEIQFHTPETFMGREKAHLLYDRYRRIPKANSQLREKLSGAMGEIWSKIQPPPGWHKLKGELVRW